MLLHRHEAERLEQKAKGALERQKITDEAEAERARKELLELQANSAAVESTGQAKAEAQSRAEAAKIEGQAAVEQARLKAQASKIEAVSEILVICLTIFGTLCVKYDTMYMYVYPLAYLYMLWHIKCQTSYVYMVHVCVFPADERCLYS